MQKTLFALALAVCSAACAAEANDEPSAATHDSLASGTNPAWKAVTLVFPNLDAEYVDEKGVQQHSKATMDPNRMQTAINSAREWPQKLSQWSDGMGSASMDIVVVKDPIRHVTVEDPKHPELGMWVAPGDVAAALDAHAPKGQYDSVFVLWEPQQQVDVCCAWGRGPGADTNGMTYANIQTDTGAEGMVHEWLHGAGSFYRDGHGLAVPDPHDSWKYGFLSWDDSHSWSAWYRALLGGHLLFKGEIVGYTQNVWAKGTPRVWTNAADSVTPPKPTFGKAQLTRASKLADNSAAIEWKPTPGTSHYTIRLTIKHADGSNGGFVEKYEQPFVDQNPNRVYFFISKADICLAARASRVQLDKVNAWVSVAPDHDSSADALVFDAPFDCRS